MGRSKLMLVEGTHQEKLHKKKRKPKRRTSHKKNKQKRTVGQTGGILLSGNAIRGFHHIFPAFVAAVSKPKGVESKDHYNQLKSYMPPPEMMIKRYKRMNLIK